MELKLAVVIAATERVHWSVGYWLLFSFTFHTSNKYKFRRWQWNLWSNWVFHYTSFVFVSLIKKNNSLTIRTNSNRSSSLNWFRCMYFNTQRKTKLKLLSKQSASIRWQMPVLNNYFEFSLNFSFFIFNQNENRVKNLIKCDLKHNKIN